LEIESALLQQTDSEKNIKMQNPIIILLLAMCVYMTSSTKYLVNSHRNKFGDFSLGKGFDDVVQDVLDAHVFLEDAVTYDVIPELKSSMKCGIMQKASDAKSVLGLSGEISLEYGLISGKGFLSFDEEEEKMRRKVYFKCIIDRTTFTASVNPPVKSSSHGCKFSEVPHAVLANNPSPEETQTAKSGPACKLLCCVKEWCQSADFNQDSKECLLYSTNGVDEGLEENADFIHYDRVQKNNALNPDAASIKTSEVFRKLYGLHYVNSITYGRRYEVEVQVEYGHQSDYEKIAGKIEGKARFGLFEVSASFSIENENKNSESSLKLDISSNTYGFLEKTGLRFPTGADGGNAGAKLVKDIQDNIDAMVSADDKMFKGGSHLSKAEVLQMQNGAYPLSYTTSSTKPYFPHAFGQERFDEEDMEEFLRNLGEAYELKLVLRELLEDVNVRSTTLYERFGLLTGESELSKIFLQTKRKMTTRIQKLLHLVRLYLDQVPEDIKDFDIYAWAFDKNHAELDYLTIDQLTSAIEGLLGLTDLDMNDDSTSAACVFHGIHAKLDGKQVKFAGTVHFSQLEVRHVIFDAEGQVVSLGYIPRNETGDVELVYVRNDCSMIRKDSQFWYKGARYEVESIGNEDYMIGSRVEKPKLKNVRVYIRPKDIDVKNLILLTRDDLQEVKLIGYEHSAEFSLDDDSRLLYKDGYVCDSGFGIDEARTVCTSLGYSRVDSFETNYQIPSANAFGKPHITMDKLHCPPNTAWDDNTSQNQCTWETQPSYRCSTKHGVRLICEAEKEYQPQCKVALWGSSNMDFSTKECMSDRFGAFLIDDNCNGGDDHLAVASASVSGPNCCVVLKDDAKKSMCALRHGEKLQGEDFTKRCGAGNATEYHAISVPGQTLFLSVSVTGLQNGELVELKNRITGEKIQLTDSKSKDHFNNTGECGLNYDVIISNQPQHSTCVVINREGSFMLDHVEIEVTCSIIDTPTKSPSAAPTTPYPPVRIVKFDSAAGSISNLRNRCDSSERLVSIQSAAHVLWLDAKVKAALGDDATSQGKGIPLGYDYNLQNEYFDLNDNFRSVQYIFDDLRINHGWVGDYKTNQVSGKQYYAGFGWNNRGIEDWGGDVHTTYAVICEQGPEYVVPNTCSSSRGDCLASIDGNAASMSWMTRAGACNSEVMSWSVTYAVSISGIQLQTTHHLGSGGSRTCLKFRVSVDGNRVHIRSGTIDSVAQAVQPFGSTWDFNDFSPRNAHTEIKWSPIQGKRVEITFANCHHACHTHWPISTFRFITGAAE